MGKNMGGEFSHIPVDLPIKVNSRTGKNMDKELLLRLMGTGM